MSKKGKKKRNTQRERHTHTTYFRTTYERTNERSCERKKEGAMMQNRNVSHSIAVERNRNANLFEANEKDIGNSCINANKCSKRQKNRNQRKLSPLLIRYNHGNSTAAQRRPTYFLQFNCACWLHAFTCVLHITHTRTHARACLRVLNYTFSYMICSTDTFTKSYVSLLNWFA